MGKLLAGLLLGILIAAGQVPDDPAYPILERAYEALRANDYDTAIAGFEQALALAPDRVAVRKDLGYTLLKAGDNVAAREHFGVAMKLDPADEHLALEYAFLCYETGEPVPARRIFDRLRQSNDVAAQAFENVDRPLREGIARWQEALAQSPDNFSAHEELARLAERRDQLELAAEHYAAAWRLRTSRRDLLLDLGRVWREMGRAEQAMSALLAASRGAEPRTAEQARALLPERYPYVYEFENAVALDPANAELRRELAYLHEAMGNRTAFEREIDKAPAVPQTPAAPVLAPRELTPPIDAKLMAERSLDKGYLADALRYLHSAHESDPADFDVMLQLGWTYNNLREDREAVRWFDRARYSPDARTAAEAARAYDNLAPRFRRVRTTVWMFPMVSTRWRNTFAYAQAKAALHLDGWPVRPYASLRFIGDLRGRFTPVAGLAPQYLSERSVIAALGVATPEKHGATAWFEAGQAIRYQEGPGGRSIPDYRGGVSYTKALRLAQGWFAETNDDAVFVSRFGRDTLFYSMNRVGRSLGESTQVYWNANLTADTKREYWANFVETGPGVRTTIDGVRFSVDLVRGSYLVNQANPFRPNFTDLRIGVWYAFGR